MNGMFIRFARGCGKPITAYYQFLEILAKRKEEGLPMKQAEDFVGIRLDDGYTWVHPFITDGNREDGLLGGITFIRVPNHAEPGTYDKTRLGDSAEIAAQIQFTHPGSIDTVIHQLEALREHLPKQATDD